MCSTQSGIWVLKGNARTRMLPANLDHLRVEWRKQGTYLPGLRQGTTVCVHTNMDMEQQSDHKLITPSGMGLLVYGAGSRPSYHLGVVRGNVPTGPGSLIRWHIDNEPLFGPQYSPKLIISLSFGEFCEFKVRRRAPGKVPSSIWLDHGDVLVMDGLTPSEYEHCAASGLQGPRVNLTYRWVTQHTTSCPLAGVVGCVLPTCAQGSVEPGSRWTREGVNKWSSSWGLVLLLFIRLVGKRRWRRRQSSRKVLFISLFYLSWGTNFTFFLGYDFVFCCTSEYAGS